MLVQRPPRLECVVDAIPDGVAQLVLRHPPVEGEGGDEVHVVDAGISRHVEHGFDHALADIRSTHLRQRQAHVVKGDRQFHPWLEQRR